MTHYHTHYDTTVLLYVRCTENREQRPSLLDIIRLDKGVSEDGRAGFPRPFPLLSLSLLSHARSGTSLEDVGGDVYRALGSKAPI
jgi:hypothetical protein